MVAPHVKRRRRAEAARKAAEAAAKEAAAKKAAPAPAPVVEHEPEAVFEEVVEEEESSVDPEVVEALQKLIEEADPNSFKGDGNPKAGCLNKMLGRTVRADEREAAWEIALNS